MDGLTLERIVWRPERALERVATGASHGDHAAAEAILDHADGNIPYEKGTLAASRQIETGDGGEVAFGYGDQVAVYLNAHPEWHYRDGRSGRWFEEALNADHGAILERIAEGVRRELGG